MNDTLPPGLYIVATPIGNLQDVSKRQEITLREADIIAAEDSRVTAKLLNHLGIKKRITAYHDHVDESVRAGLVEKLGDKAIALVSDAGTPLISDPGYKLVRDARAAGYLVTTVPGPCAAIAALTLAGLPTDRFVFAGFLPAKAKARTDAIRELAAIRATLIFYDSGPRLAKSLQALSAELGDREAAVAREISKAFEECVTGTLDELAARYADAPPKGEIVIVVGPPGEADAASEADIDAALAEALERLPPGKAAREVAKALHLPSEGLYERAMALKTGG
ncbi:16S rRNA (cytidine(1402)-2'-O)-methyltransferase [Parasphingopyxis sp.]|uniref:16S rRNA (cytidine(1402)-2'-O)-methyltransferase n=1 Tax=Parasphingopyxis sp. TaxID=1920299 RepID=UPI00260D2493|nr:16S rRNA (cytidine(1402)-2'-O)-methyltransferase [Parasphingopyxis sp.]